MTPPADPRPPAEILTPEQVASMRRDAARDGRYAKIVELADSHEQLRADLAALRAESAQLRETLAKIGALFTADNVCGRYQPYKHGTCWECGYDDISHAVKSVLAPCPTEEPR